MAKNPEKCRLQALIDFAAGRPDWIRYIATTLGTSPGALPHVSPTALTPELEEQIRAGLQALDTGRPLAHVLGHWEFWSLELEVTPDVLIPRPDTETLVEAALEGLSGVRCPVVADLGTGSGAIAVAIATERRDATVVATDRSEEALTVARRNADRHGLDIDFRHGNWCKVLEDDRYDLIVSNPPYVRADDSHLDRGDLPYEPRAALVPGPTGLEAFDIIANGSLRCLRPDGFLVLEHGYDQRDAVSHLLENSGYRDIRLKDDLTGTPRVVSARRPGSPVS